MNKIYLQAYILCLQSFHNILKQSIPLFSLYLLFNLYLTQSSQEMLIKLNAQ